MQQSDRADLEDGVVVGGGPAGLALAASLQRKNISPLVVDAAAEVGASWKGHYDRLHLHTVRWLSHLPGLRIPRSEGKWVPRDGVVRYLKDYAEHHRLRIQHNTTVAKVEPDGSGWRLDTDHGTLRAQVVAIATGYNRQPVVPDWPDSDSFEGEIIHSSHYRNGRPYADKDALIVGIGNSGAEIAVDLTEHGARKVWLSVRTPPNIQRRDVGGLPTQVIGVVSRKLPGRVIDKLSLTTQRLTVGDLTPYGLGPPQRGVYSRAHGDERIPLLDVGLLDALKARKVSVVAPVDAFEGREVILSDGTRLAPDVVIAATGFRRGLEPLVGHLGVLDGKGNPSVHGATTHPNAPNLYFIGYSNPLSGNLRELGIDARRIARVVASSVS